MLSETINNITLAVHTLVSERNKLDPNTEKYEELSEEIKLLQNDLVTISILGDD